jgi:hypothetical protein
MDKKELTKILKPLIKECVKEVIMEEPGALSHIIKEVAQGMGAQQLVERKQDKPIKQFIKKARPKVDLQEQRKKLMNSIGGSDKFNGMNLFEGTTPTPAQSGESQKFGALKDSDPNDSGVDLSAFGL